MSLEERERQEVQQPSGQLDSQPTGVHTPNQTTSQPNITPTPVERAAGIAKEQANQAADAWRKGEFMQDAALDSAANSDDRLIALLSYIIPLVMPIIVLLSESSKNRPFQRYHAVQSLALSIVFVAISAIVTVGTAIIQIVPLIGNLIGLVVLCLSPIAFLMGVVALLYYGYQAYQGKRFAIPGLTSMLHEQGWL